MTTAILLAIGFAAGWTAARVAVRKGQVVLPAEVPADTVEVRMRYAEGAAAKW